MGPSHDTAARAPSAEPTTESGESAQASSQTRFVTGGNVPPVAGAAATPTGPSASDQAFGGAVHGTHETPDQQAARQELGEAVDWMAHDELGWDKLGALKAKLDAAFAPMPPGMSHYIEAVYALANLRNGVDADDAKWQHQKQLFSRHRGAARSYLSAYEGKALDHAEREVEQLHAVMPQAGDRATVVSTPEGIARDAKDGEDRATFDRRAHDDLQKGKAVAALVHDKNGWMVSGGFYGTATTEITTGVRDLERAMTLAADSPQRTQHMGAAMSEIETGLANLPAGVDPVTFLREERERNIDMLGKAGDLASLIPGPFGQSLGVALHAAANGVRYESGEMSGAEFWTRTLGDAVKAAVGGKLGQSGSLFSRSIISAVADVAPEFAGDCVRIYKADDLTTEQRAEHVRQAILSAAFKIFVHAVTNVLALGKGDALGDEEKAEVLKKANEIGTLLGIDWPLLQPQLERLNELKDLHPKRAE